VAKHRAQSHRRHACPRHMQGMSGHSIASNRPVSRCMMSVCGLSCHVISVWLQGSTQLRNHLFFEVQLLKRLHSAAIDEVDALCFARVC
jgi:hypothetical protein